MDKTGRNGHIGDIKSSSLDRYDKSKATKHVG